MDWIKFLGGLFNAAGALIAGLFAIAKTAHDEKRGAQVEAGKVAADAADRSKAIANAVANGPDTKAEVEDRLDKGTF